MIRIVLLGRTGNILFQYALGRYLSNKHGVPLVLDASWYNSEGWCEVSHFLKLPLGAKVIRPFSLLSRALRNLTGKHWWQLIGKRLTRESNLNQSFNPDLRNAALNSTLFGYFQTQLYFEPIAESLRNDLCQWFADAVSIDASLLAQISSQHSVAIHVRRGDYLVHAAFQVCNPEYYAEAVRRMQLIDPHAKFYIFSDDPAWCSDVFVGDEFEVINSGTAGSNPLHDLFLMSRANHHIIANSSYSWWAAWLGKKVGQKVFMPDHWYSRDSGMVAPIEEKNPGDWITVSSQRLIV